uniref:Class I hydrophobin POH1 n=1 Tax=Pleurotus ostreatus TaxID=5322 RepID=POH1_PLEOS|nr:POH1 hydrophobin [Pleurotus ostreatus]CAA74986.1 hydrophobin [Pleurotus ostreatus]
MFSIRISTVVLAASALLAVAIPMTNTETPQCNTGPIQCCNSVQSATSSAAAGPLAALGVLSGIASLLGEVGLDCSPLQVIGVGANSCSSQAACCTGNTFNGAVVLGCSPIKLL